MNILYTKRHSKHIYIFNLLLGLMLRLSLINIIRHKEKDALDVYWNDYFIYFSGYTTQKLKFYR